MKRSKLIACQNDCRAILTAIAYQMLAPAQMQLPTLHLPSLQEGSLILSHVQKIKEREISSSNFVILTFFIGQFFSQEMN